VLYRTWMPGSRARRVYIHSAPFLINLSNARLVCVGWTHLIFYSLTTVVERNCVQSSYTYRYSKMLRRQIVNNSNDIGSYKTQLTRGPYSHVAG